jgi:hypothetical protein
MFLFLLPHAIQHNSFNNCFIPFAMAPLIVACPNINQGFVVKGKSHHHLPFAFLDAMQHCMNGAQLIVLICSFLWNGDVCYNFG